MYRSGATIMSSLTYTEKAKLERLFGVSTGYVANLNDTTFGHFFADEQPERLSSTRSLKSLSASMLVSLVQSERRRTAR
jgi:hypothetical protein